MHSIAIVVAMTNRGQVIGNMGQMPWGNLPCDLEYFKKLTMGHLVVMGFNTLVSVSKIIKRKTNILPGRTICVLTRDQDKLAQFPDCIWLPDVMSVIRISQRTRVFIVGGEDVYKQFIDIPEVRTIYMTRIFANYHGDAVFPVFSKDDWLTIRQDSHPESDQNRHVLVFETLIRKN